MNIKQLTNISLIIMAGEDKENELKEELELYHFMSFT